MVAVKFKSGTIEMENAVPLPEFVVCYCYVA